MDKEILVSDTHLYNFTTSSQCQLINGTAKSSVLWYFDPPIHLKKDDIQVAYLSVQHGEFPCSMYIVPATKTKLYITELGTTTLYQISAGNYGIDTFISALQAQLPARYALTFSSIALKYTLTNTTNDFTIETSTTMGRYLGMGNSQLNSASKVIVFPNIPNFLPTMRLSICSTGLGVNNTKTSSNAGSMICSVQNNAVQLSTMMYQNYTNTRFILGTDILSDFHVQVYDDEGEFVDFQNINWNLCVKVEIERWQKRYDDLGNNVES